MDIDMKNQMFDGVGGGVLGFGTFTFVSLLKSS